MPKPQICVECGKEFIPRSHNQILCSLECKQKRRKRQHDEFWKTISKNCPVCGKPLAPNSRTKYCSVNCRKIAKGQGETRYPCDQCTLKSCAGWCKNWESWFNEQWERTRMQIAGGNVKYKPKPKSRTRKKEELWITEMKAKALGISYGRLMGMRYLEGK